MSQGTGLGSRVASACKQGVPEFRVKGVGFRIQRLGIRGASANISQGLGFGVQGVGFGLVWEQRFSPE